MALKATLARNRCEAWGYCARIAPEIFETDPQGRVIMEMVPEELRAKAILAMQECPTAAVGVAEEPPPS